MPTTRQFSYVSHNRLSRLVILCTHYAPLEQSTSRGVFFVAPDVSTFKSDSYKHYSLLPPFPTYYPIMDTTWVADHLYKKKINKKKNSTVTSFSPSNKGDIRPIIRRLGEVACHACSSPYTWTKIWGGRRRWWRKNNEQLSYANGCDPLLSQKPMNAPCWRLRHHRRFAQFYPSDGGDIRLMVGGYLKGHSELNRWAAICTHVGICPP